jgi:hypothetical protein
MGKTAFGYSANDVLESARSPNRQLATAPTAAFSPVRTMPPAQHGSPPPSAPMPGLPPMPPPRSSSPTPPPPLAATQFAPPPMAPPQPYATGPQGGAYVPVTGANAKTMFVQAGPPGPPGPGMPSPPAPSYQPPSAMAATLIPPPVQQIAVPVQPHAARTMVPQMAIPAAQPPPYLSTQTGSRLIRPIEPWRDGLRAWMFLGGLALIAAFVTPLTTSPMSFAWTLILEGHGTARLPPLMLAAVGFLAIVLAVVPMPSLVRGLIATLLGLAGIAVPIALAGLPPWQLLAPLIGIVLLVPGLLVRDEYRDAMSARLLVTAGALGVLLPLVVPQQGAIPLVSVFRALIDLPGSQKVAPALVIAQLTIVVMSLLAWLPAPVTGGAKVWAWLLIAWALVVHIVALALAGGIVGAITGSPNQALLAWVAGGASAVGSAYLVIVGYGLATVIGKQLE